MTLFPKNRSRCNVDPTQSVDAFFREKSPLISGGAKKEPLQAFCLLALLDSFVSQILDHYFDS